MATIVYDDYMWRLFTESPQTVFSIDLPKDLQWSDQFGWTPVGQNTEYGTTGALLIQEGVKQKGRPITLTGLDNMAWITKEQAETLYSMYSTPGLIMKLRFFNTFNDSEYLFEFNVMFRQGEIPIEVKPIKQWDQFEANAYLIVQNIKLMETNAYGV